MSTRSTTPLTSPAPSKLTPAIDWPRYLADDGRRRPRFVIMGQPSYFTELCECSAATFRSRCGRTTCAFGSLDDLAPYLNAALVGFALRFPRPDRDRHAGDPAALEARPHRDSRSAIGEMLGKAYVARHFPPAAKARMDELVGNLRAAFATLDRRARLDGPRDAPRGARRSSPSSRSRSATRTSGGTTRGSSFKRGRPVRQRAARARGPSTGANCASSASRSTRPSGA